MTAQAQYSKNFKIGYKEKALMAVVQTLGLETPQNNLQG